MKTYGEVAVYIHYMEVSDQRHVPAALQTPPPPAGENERYQLDRRLGVPQSRYGRYAEMKILDPTGTLNPDHSFRP
jgi:hypothetical protein